MLYFYYENICELANGEVRTLTYVYYTTAMSASCVIKSTKEACNCHPLFLWPHVIEQYIVSEVRITTLIADTFIMQCIKKLRSPPINPERCESCERSNSSKGQSDGAREQTARKLTALL